MTEEVNPIVAVQRAVLKSGDVFVSNYACARVPRVRGDIPREGELTEERWLEFIELLLKTGKVLHCKEHRSSSTE